jgi:hypothetical protein
VDAPTRVAHLKNASLEWRLDHWKVVTGSDDGPGQAKQPDPAAALAPGNTNDERRDD